MSWMIDSIMVSADWSSLGRWLERRLIGGMRVPTTRTWEAEAEVTERWTGSITNRAETLGGHLIQPSTPSEIISILYIPG